MGQKKKKKKNEIVELTEAVNTIVVARIWEWGWGKQRVVIQWVQSFSLQDKVWRVTINIMVKLCINAQYVLCISKFKRADIK